MKTVIFNGSPRKNGGTSAMVEAFIQESAGEVFLVETYRADISPCVDCRWCWDHPGCVVQDAMQEVYRQLAQADQIVLASPIYFAELTGSLLQVASRLQSIWVAKAFRGERLLPDKPRRGAVFLTDGGDGCTDTALAMAKRLLRTMGAPFEEWIYCTGTDLPDGNERISKAREQARKLAVRWSNTPIGQGQETSNNKK